MHPVPRVIDGYKIDEAELEKTVLVTEFETLAVSVNMAHVQPDVLWSFGDHLSVTCAQF